MLELEQPAVLRPQLADSPAVDLVGHSCHAHPANLQSSVVTAFGISRPPAAVNEPVRSYEPGSPERAELQAELARMQSERIAVPMVIGGKDVETATTFEAVMPHRKDHVLADVSRGDASHVQQAIDAARAAHHDWSRLPWEERASVFLRAAELLSGPFRPVINAATMLDQSKTAHQAEIDAACELIDFWRFNVEYMTRIYADQPVSSQGVWNRMEYRPLEGFVFAVSPFNFTAIGGNLLVVAGADGQHRALEAGLDRRARGARRDARAPGRRAARRRDQPRLRLGRRDRRRRAREPGARRDPLHRLDPGLPGDVEHGRLEHRALSQLPAPRRRDGRQGLHRRASFRRRRRARDGDRARLVRVPGAEVLGQLTRLCAVESVAGAARAARRRGKRGEDG